MKEIITIQHAESEQHLNGMVGGWTDWPLTERGRRQAESIGLSLQKRLAPEKTYIMYSSDLARARETAEIAGRHIGLAPVLRKELREIYFGDATGKSMEWYHQNALPKTGPYFTYRNRPGAESLLDVYRRLLPFTEELLASPHQHFIVASHSAALGMFFSRWLQIDLEKTPCSLFAGEAAGVSRLSQTEEGHFMLHYLNDVSDWAGQI